MSIIKVFSYILAILALLLFVFFSSTKSLQIFSINYILGTGSVGARNLDLQDEIFRAEAVRHLKAAGLDKGKIVYDVGYGSGAMTQFLSEAVSDGGLVVAVDVSKEQLDLTRSKIAQSGHNNVKFVEDDITKIDSNKYPKADMVYARFLLMHVVDRSKAIENIASLLKSGGKLVLQESTMSSILEQNDNPAIRRYFELIVNYGKLKGFDYNIGRKLPRLCADSGKFSHVESYKVVPSTNDQVIELLRRRLDELEGSLVKSYHTHTGPSPSTSRVVST